MPLLDQNRTNTASPSNQRIPEEGPRSIPLVLNFASVASFDLDLEAIQTQGKLSMIQTVFIDASNSAVDVTVAVNVSGQQIIAPAGTQGYYSLLVPNPVRMVLSVPGAGANIARIQLINVPIPGVVWSVI